MNKILKKQGVTSMVDLTNKLVSRLDFTNTTYLAGFLGVSERALGSWKKLDFNRLTPKAYRMVRLLEVLDFMEEEWKQADLSPAVLKAVLENGRIQLDDDEEEDISLISLIQSDPRLKTWKPCVIAAVQDFDKDGGIFGSAATR